MVPKKVNRIVYDISKMVSKHKADIHWESCISKNEFLDKIVSELALAAASSIKNQTYLKYPKILSILADVCSLAYTQSSNFPFLSNSTITCLGLGIKQCFIPPYPLI